MGEYSDLIDQPAGKEPPSGFKKYSDLIDSPAQATPQAIADPDRGASFMALSDAKHADDPQTRMHVFAKARFPDLPESEALKRYQIIDGRVAYQADDGNLYFENEASFLKSLGSDLLSHSGAVIGSGIGAAKGAALGAAGGPPGMAAGGLLGAFAGGAAGEGIRKGVANVVLDEPQTTGEVLTDMATEGALSAAGEGVGRFAGYGLKSYLSRGGKDVSQLGRASRDEILDADLDKFTDITTKAQQQGVDLTLPEALGGRELINRQALLRDLPSSSSKIEGFLKVRSGQVRNAVFKYMDNLSKETTPEVAYRRGIGATEDARTALDTARREASSEFFEKAASDSVDIKPVIDLLDKRITKASGTKIGSALASVRKALTRSGKVGSKSLTINKTQIDELGIAKGDLDDVIENAVNRGYRGQVRELMQVKEELLKAMDQSPLYRQGRQTFEALSKPINQLDESLAGTVLREGKRPVPDLGRVLFGKLSSPAAVKETRNYISSQSPQAWNDVVRGHIQTTIEELAESSVGETLNLGGQLRKKLIGTETKRVMMKNALSPQQFKALMDLSEVLNATGRAMKGQSITAQRQQMIKELGREATHGFQKGADVVTTVASPNLWPARIRGWYTEIQLGKHADRMAELFTNPNSMATLRKQAEILKKATSKTTYIPALGASLGAILGAKE